jgi:hypothetical protein
MTARCCGCGRALELGKELVYIPDPGVCSVHCPLNLLFWGKKGKKRKKEKKKEKKKHCRPADVASLQCHPLPRCWHASIVVAMRVFIQTRLLPCHTSAPLFMHAVCTALITPPRVSHIPFKTQRSIQPRPANLLRPTDSGTEGVGHRQRVKGVVGGAKNARAHIHAQACGWARFGSVRFIWPSTKKFRTGGRALSPADPI